MYTSDVANIAYNGFMRIFNEANNSQPSNEAMIAVGGIQRGLQCCGSNGPSSWTQIPDTCCAEGANCTLSNSFQTGCADMIKEFVNSSGLLIAWFAVIFAAIQLVGVIFACCLSNSIRNAQRRQYA